MSHPAVLVSVHLAMPWRSPGESTAGRWSEVLHLEGPEKWDKTLGKMGKSWVKETWSWMFINKNRKNTGNGCDIKKRGFPTPTEPQKRLRFLGFIPKKLGVDAAFHGVQLSSSSIQQGSYSLSWAENRLEHIPQDPMEKKSKVDPYVDPIHFNDLNHPKIWNFWGIR